MEKAIFIDKVKNGKELLKHKVIGFFTNIKQYFDTRKDPKFNDFLARVRIELCKRYGAEYTLTIFGKIDSSVFVRYYYDGNTSQTDVDEVVDVLEMHMHFYWFKRSLIS